MWGVWGNEPRTPKTLRPSTERESKRDREIKRERDKEREREREREEETCGTEQVSLVTSVSVHWGNTSKSSQSLR